MGAFTLPGRDPSFSLQSLLQHEGITANVSGFLIHGLLVLQQGYILTSMILASAMVCLIERRFRSAAAWLLIASAFTFSGLMHSYQVRGNIVDFLLPWAEDGGSGVFRFSAVPVGIGYLLCACIFFAAGRKPQDEYPGS